MHEEPKSAPSPGTPPAGGARWALRIGVPLAVVFAGVAVAADFSVVSLPFAEVGANNDAGRVFVVRP